MLWCSAPRPSLSFLLPHCVQERNPVTIQWNNLAPLCSMEFRSQRPLWRQKELFHPIIVAFSEEKPYSFVNWRKKNGANPEWKRGLPGTPLDGARCVLLAMDFMEYGLCRWWSYFFSVTFYSSFDFISLSYITIPKNKGRIKFNRGKNNCDIAMWTYGHVEVWTCWRVDVWTLALCSVLNT